MNTPLVPVVVGRAEVVVMVIVVVVIIIVVVASDDLKGAGAAEKRIIFEAAYADLVHTRRCVFRNVHIVVAHCRLTIYNKKLR